jgi:hypothetical protein
MLDPKPKLKYELHYWDTDVTGSSENELESLLLKPIYFPKQGQLGEWKYKLAIGAELIFDFKNTEKGTETPGLKRRIFCNTQLSNTMVFQFPSDS